MFSRTVFNKKDNLEEHNIHFGIIFDVWMELSVHCSSNCKSIIYEVMIDCRDLYIYLEKSIGNL